jgi:hypothetical protein
MGKARPSANLQFSMASEYNEKRTPQYGCPSVTRCMHFLAFSRDDLQTLNPLEVPTIVGEKFDIMVDTSGGDK